MRKFFPFLLLLLIFLQSGGVLLWFQLRQINVQSEMREAIDRNEARLVNIELSQEYYLKNVRDGGDEIIIQGKYFDIKSIKFFKNKVQLIGLFDTKETSLFNFLSLYLNHTSSKQKQLPVSATILLALNYFPPLNDCEFYLQGIKNETIFQYNYFSKSFPTKVSTPPPQFFS